MFKAFICLLLSGVMLFTASCDSGAAAVPTDTNVKAAHSASPSAQTPEILPNTPVPAESASTVIDKELTIDEKNRVAQQLLAKLRREYQLAQWSLGDDFEYTGPREQSDPLIHYYKIILSDLIFGLKGIYKDCLNDEELDFVSNVADKYGGCSDSDIYFGYTKSGLHFFALGSWTPGYIAHYGEPINIIRGDEHAEAVRNGFYKTVLCMYDVYVEDLTHLRTTVDIQPEIYKFRRFSKDSFDLLPLATDLTENQSAFFEKHNRTLAINGEIKCDTWNLFAGYDASPIIQTEWESAITSGLDFFIVINVDGEEVKLTRYLYVQ